MKKWVVLGLLSVCLFGVVGVGFAVDRGYANPQMLISVDELQAKMDAGEEIVVVSVDKGANYLLGHIPGAVNIWGEEMVNTDHPTSGMIPTPEGFAKLMGEKGISNSSHVVVYDNSGGLWAARVWWFMRVYGHHKVQLLDGGLKAWKAAGNKVAHLGTKIKKTTYEVKANNYQYVISSEEVLTKLEDPNFVMIDARTDDEYNGVKTFSGANRKGHIPGAVHIEWNRTLNEDGTLKSAEELIALYESMGVTPDKEIAAHCHTAVRSAHTFFVLRLLGYPVVRNFDESWIGWANNESLPIE